MTDRTEDFRLIAAALPPPSRVSPPLSKPKRPSGVLKQVSTLGDFHATAASIAKNIHVVSQKLERLTRLVQQRGLFNDPASEINSLVHSIKQDMQNLNAQLDVSQTYVDRRKAEKGERNQAASHSIHVVGQLKTELMDTARVFKDVLQQRSTNLKAQKDHRDRFFSSQSPTLALARPSVYKPLGISPIKAQDSGGGAGYSGVGRNGGIGSEGKGSRLGDEGGATLPRPEQVTSLPEMEQEVSADTPLIAPVGMQQQRQQTQMQLITGNETYLESRSTAVQEVETHIAELGLIFNKLATMLQDQREMVESIHDNVEDAGESVNRGHLALMGTLQALNSNWRLASTVAGIVILFFIFFFVFLV